MASAKRPLSALRLRCRKSDPGLILLARERIPALASILSLLALRSQILLGNDGGNILQLLTLNEIDEFYAHRVPTSLPDLADAQANPSKHIIEAEPAGGDHFRQRGRVRAVRALLVGPDRARRRPPLPELVLATMAQARVTKLVTVPTVLKNILEHVRQSGQRPHFPALDFVVSASEKIPPEIFSRFHQQFGVELFDSIGSSEITYEWIANRQKEFKRGSLGKPIFGYEVRLVAPDRGDVIEPSVPGEAWIKSRTACFFYWRKYDKSRETFIGEWTRTGDNLYFDEDGYFWFSGRNNDMFKVKGLWVTPIDIEAALTGHPAVREAAVKSIRDLGQRVVPKLDDARSVARSPEAKDRIQRLIDDLRAAPSVAELLQIRSVHILELIATPAARDLLANLSKGAPGARLTEEAKASVARLSAK